MENEKEKYFILGNNNYHVEYDRLEDVSLFYKNKRVMTYNKDIRAIWLYKNVKSLYKRLSVKVIDNFFKRDCITFDKEDLPILKNAIYNDIEYIGTYEIIVM